jgi:hypothetical protein
MPGNWVFDYIDNQTVNCPAFPKAGAGCRWSLIKLQSMSFDGMFVTTPKVITLRSRAQACLGETCKTCGGEIITIIGGFPGSGFITLRGKDRE